MANLYGLKKFDLNLLVIFECIYQHLSISRAAETLFITPSAVSQSLQRLRTQLNDPLFIRSGKGITPTQMSVNLHYLLEKLKPAGENDFYCQPGQFKKTVCHL